MHTEGKALCVGAVILWMAAGAWGGTLATDPNGMEDWQGSAEFDSSVEFDDAFIATMDYCVYAPGMFHGTWGVEPNSSHYVYAYQIVDVIETGLSTAYIDLFTVGLDSGTQAANIGYLCELTADVVPDAVRFTSSSALWRFNAPSIYEGDRGAVLYFSSPFGPHWVSGTLRGTLSMQATQPLPSPVPEPGTLALLGVVGLWSLAGRKRRR